MSVHEFQLQTSKIYAGILSSAYLMSMTVICLLPVSVLVKALFALAVTAYMGWIVWKYCLVKATSAIHSIRSVSEQKWVVSMAGRELEAELLGDSTLTRWVSILRFKVSGQKWPVSCILFVDSLPDDQYRRLLVAAH